MARISLNIKLMISLFNTAKTSAFKIKYDFMKRGSMNAYNTLLANEQLSTEEIEALNWKKTKDLISHSMRNSAFYQKLYSNIGFQIGDIKNTKAFEGLPILTKKDLRGSASSILCKGVRLRDCNLVSTGGSTGEPVTVYHPKSVPRSASLWRMMHWWNVGLGSDMATIYREPKASLKRKMLDRTIWWPRKRILLDATTLTDESIKQWIRECDRNQPAILHGYVGAVDYVAGKILEWGMTPWSPKAVWVTSAPLSSTQRQRIERAFSAKVYDQYGSCEIFYLASETPFADGLAVFHDLRKIEIVDDEGKNVPNGVEGKILVTDLENTAFPLIRYEIGDRGSYLKKQEKWALPFPRLSPVKGRVSDFLTFPNGQSVSGEFWTTLFDDFPEAVQQFQVIQEKDQSILVKYVKSTLPNSESLVEIVIQRITTILNGAVTVKSQAVDQIPSDSGKTRYIIKK